MVRLGDEAQVVVCFGPFEIVVTIVQDRCTVCAERTIGSELFWTHPIELLGDEAQVEACFGLFVDSANLDAR
jgi:ArsR family metal-binding transcriptional regulator